MMKVKIGCPNCKHSASIKLEKVREDTRKMMFGPKSTPCGHCGGEIAVDSVTVYMDIEVKSDGGNSDGGKESATESLDEYIEENESQEMEDLI